MALCCFHFRAKEIKFLDKCIERQEKRNDELDKETAKFKSFIDDRNFERDFLIHEKDTLRRNERFVRVDWIDFLCFFFFF